jgi:hypothetical protein
VSYAFEVLSSFASNYKYIGCVDQIIDEDCNLDIFQQPASTSKLVKELVIGELLIFKCVDPKDIKCHFQWWGNMKPCFL